MLVFPTEDWVGAWVCLANSDSDFRTSGQGWDGSVCMIIRDLPGAALPTYIRLTGRDGQWSDFGVGHEPPPAGSQLSLSGPHGVWRQIVRQQLGPLRAILRGDVLVKGHLPDLLKYRTSVVVLCELAGRLDTRFVDD